MRPCVGTVQFLSFSVNWGHLTRETDRETERQYATLWHRNINRINKEHDHGNNQHFNHSPNGGDIISKLKVGDRVRLKVRLLNGYKGEATVLRIDHQDGLKDLIDIWPDGYTSPMYGQRGVTCLRHEVAKIRKQVPRT